MQPHHDFAYLRIKITADIRQGCDEVKREKQVDRYRQLWSSNGRLQQVLLIMQDLLRRYSLPFFLCHPFAIGMYSIFSRTPDKMTESIRPFDMTVLKHYCSEMPMIESYILHRGERNPLTRRLMWSHSDCRSSYTAFLCSRPLMSSSCSILLGLVMFPRCSYWIFSPAFEHFYP